MFKDVLFTKAEVTEIKEYDDSRLKAYVKDVCEKADTAVQKGTGSLVGYDDKYTILSVCFAYYLSGDSKYSDLGKEMLFHILESNRWYDCEEEPCEENKYDIHAGLYTGHKCLDTSFLLSYFGEQLSEEEQKLIAEKLYKKAILPIMEQWILPNKKVHTLDTMGHNFWIYILSTAALLTLVIKDHIPDAEKYIEMFNKAIAAWYVYKGNPLNAKPQNIDNGGYYESTGYAETCSHEYMFYAYAHNRAFGKHPFDDSEIMASIGRFHTQTFYSSDKDDYSLEFGDCGDPYRDTQFALILYGLGTPELRWFARESKSPTCDVFMRMMTWKEVYTKEAYPPKELSACYSKIGWATFRDSHEKNSTMLAIKCGDTWNHAHADCAHFSLYRKGDTEIYDSGSPPGYSKPSYQKYYVTSQAHNVLLFNDKGQDFRDNYKNHAHIPGRLLNYIDDSGFRYVVADGTGPMGRYFRKHHRHFLWLDGFILVYDDVECYDFGKVSFLLHAREKNCFKMLSPCTETKHEGYINKSEKPNDIYTAFNVHTDDEGHAKFVGAILLDEKQELKYNEITDGCKITCGKTTVYINFRSDGKIMHRNCINIMDGITTDAVIVVNDGEKYGIVNGSIIRKDGNSYLDTLSRVTGWADKYK